jgi:GDSL-like lipase/acylhydrolase family protein
LRLEAIKSLALVCFSMLVGLLFLEVAVRLIEPREVLREYFQRPDPVLHHKFIPGGHGFHKAPEFSAAYAINSLGLRDREMPRAKPAGTRRILMLGDSFTEGNGVDASDTFSSQLQAMLDQAGLGKRWQVINAGVGSYSPLLEYLYLKNGGLDLQPDLVILNLDLSDVYDDIQYAQLAVLDASGDPVAVRADPEPAKGSWVVEVLVGIKDFFKKHTRTYNFVKRRIAGYVEAGRHKPNFSGDVRFDKYATMRDTAPQDDHAWSLTYGYLLRIRELLKARGIDFWVTVYPYGLQVSPREWAEGRQFWGFEPGKTYSARPQALVETFGRENGIPVINMTEEFKERSRTVYPLYFAGDGHWRPAGHEVVANVLYRALLPYFEAREAGSAASSDDRSR